MEKGGQKITEKIRKVFFFFTNSYTDEFYYVAYQLSACISYKRSLTISILLVTTCSMARMDPLQISKCPRKHSYKNNHNLFGLISTKLYTKLQLMADLSFFLSKVNARRHIT